MPSRRLERLNSLLKEVIAEVITRDVRNPHVNSLLTVTRVDISNDLHHAKVYVSIIGSDLIKQETLDALQTAAGYIAVNSAKKVVMRYFPNLTFRLDDSVDRHMRIEKLLSDLSTERQSRRDVESQDISEEL